MPHVTTLEYSEPLVRAAVFAFWRRSVGVGFFIALSLIIFSLSFLIWHGDRSWVVGALGAVFLLALTFAFLVYFVHLRNSLAKFRAMGAPVATLSFDDASFTMSSGLGSTSLRWSAVTELWRYPSFWLLLFSKAQFVTIPLATVSPEARAFMLSRVAAVGGKIVD